MCTCNHLKMTTRNTDQCRCWEFVTAAQSHNIHPDLWACSVIASASQIKHPTSVLSSAFTWINKSLVVEMERMQKASRRDVCMQAAVKLMEISFCSSWLTMLLPSLPHLSPLPPSYSLPSYRHSRHAISLCLLLLHPSVADPAPAIHLFIPCDITQSNNVSLFGASTLCTRYNARNRAQHHENEVIAIQSNRAMANKSCDPSSAWPRSQGAVCDAVFHVLQHLNEKAI